MIISKLNLDLIDPDLHSAAYDDYHNSSENFIYLARPGNEMIVALNNYKQLKQIGRYEPALIGAYQSVKINHSNLSLDIVDWLFSKADREACIKLGDMTTEMPTTVYRGVSGHGRRRRIAGWSWTTSIEVACWFARRLSLPNPAIYSTIVDYNEIYYYTNEPTESEVIVKPKAPQRMKLSEAEMISHANHHQIVLENAQRAATAKLWDMASKLAATRNGSK